MAKRKSTPFTPPHAHTTGVFPLAPDRLGGVGGLRCEQRGERGLAQPEQPEQPARGGDRRARGCWWGSTTAARRNRGKSAQAAAATAGGKDFEMLMRAMMP